MNAFLEFISREAGQRRRAALDNALNEFADYYLGPTGIPDRLRAAGIMNPVNDLEQASVNSQMAFDRDRTAEERVGAGINALTDMATVLAPAAAARYVDGPAVNALVDAFTGLGGPTREGLQDAGRRFAADESGALFGGSTVDEVIDFTREGRPFYHSGSADVAEDIHKWGVEPQAGDWVREIAGGAFDDEMADAPAAAWWSDAPDWVRAKVARAAKKHVSDVTTEDIRKYGHLSIADADEWGGSVYRVGEDGLSEGEYSRLTDLDGNEIRLYETPLYDHDTQGKYPFGVERNELITAETIDPKYTLTGDELVDFLSGFEGGGVQASINPAQQQAQDILDLLSEGRASEVTDDMMAAADDMYLFNNYDLPMDEASRMARAREMGFDTDTPLFHGGLNPHQAPDDFRNVWSYDEEGGTYINDAYHGAGYYTTTSSHDASMNYGRPEGPDVRNKIESRYDRIQEMDFDELADEIRLTLEPSDVEALDPEAARLLREVNQKDQGALTTGDTEAWEDYILGSPILNDLADLTARKQVGKTDGFVSGLFGRATKPVRTKNPNSTFFELHQNLGNPDDFLEEAGGDMDLATDLALDASFEEPPVGPLVDFTDGAIASLYDADLYEQADQLRADIFERGLDRGGLDAADLEHVVRNSQAAEYGIDYGISPGAMLQDGYKASGYDAIDLPNPFSTFPGMSDTQGTAFHRVFTDPTALRSRFARFDPRLRHLRNLSAGVGVAGLTQADVDEINAYLEQNGL